MLLSIIASAILVGSGPVTGSQSDLRSSFLHPPESARPWVYWFWLNGNITREGITADLEAMKRVGIGGALIMEVDQGVPLGPVPFAGPQWRDLFHHVVTEASRLGLEINMNDDAGWDGSGGPWITPDVAMQKLVWSETAVEGGKPVEIALPQPTTVGNFYRDVAVMAVPTKDSYRIGDIAGKSALERRDVAWSPTDNERTESAFSKKEVVDLTTSMGSDGLLNWSPPAGQWTVLRFGHTLTGAENAPAPLSGRGLECDKLSQAGVEANFNGLIGKLVADSGPLTGKSFVRTHIDSWENHSQNWTETFRTEFLSRRGYDPMPFLPVMTGRLVESATVSERFLWDVRRTVADLVQDNYAGRMHTLCATHGLSFSDEAYGDCVFDDMAYAGRADEPMAEFWSWPNNFTGGSVTEMVSAGHVYGKPIIGAESFTATDGEKWQHHPASIKALGDWAFCQGINRFVFHRYAMQPWLDVKPGMGMGPWGIHYERTQTWWELSRPWHEYLARCQYVLRQGKPVVDLLYMAPEGAPSAFVPPVNHGNYKADGCPAEVVLQRLSVSRGKLVLPDGMTYQALVLPNSPLTPPVLAKIEALVKAGASVIGPRPPSVSPSLSRYPECDAEVAASVGRLWGSGHVVKDIAPDRFLASEKVAPDFTANRALGYNHRRIGETDLYFVSNPDRRAVAASCQFRIGGKVAELWDPETGATSPLPARSLGPDLSQTDIYLRPTQSVFVLFRPARRGEAIIRDLGQPSRNAPPPVIDVHRATWGPANDPARTKDVTDFVRQEVARGLSEFPVMDLVATGDPANNVVKTLTVEYAIGGVQKTAIATDPDRLIFELPDDPEPNLEMLSDHSVAARKGGAYTLHLANRAVHLRAPAPAPPFVLKSDWRLNLPGSPSMTLSNLISWSEQESDAVRYFSGTASYTTGFEAPAAIMRSGQRVWLDLGRVEVMARVKLNGHALGILWKAPFRVDATSALLKGHNELEIEVTNLWPNRLIGDERLAPDSDRNPDGTLRSWPDWLTKGDKSPTGRTSFATWRQYGPDDRLLPSGLLGPVKLEAESVVTFRRK